MQLLTSIPSVLADNALDLLSIVSYAVKGEIHFCCATLLAVALPSIHDPFQGRAFLAVWETLERGFPSRRWLEHQSREGSLEAPIGGFIALYSFLVVEPGNLHWTDVTLRLCSAFTSLALALPGAAVASALLESGDPRIIENYTEQLAAKRRVPFSRKYRLTLQVLTAVPAWLYVLPRIDISSLLFIMEGGILFFLSCLSLACGIPVASLGVCLFSFLQSLCQVEDFSCHLGSWDAWLQLAVLIMCYAAAVVSYCIELWRWIYEKPGEGQGHPPPRTELE